MKQVFFKGARLVWALCLFFFASGQEAQAQLSDTTRRSGGLRIALLTCGPGTEFIGASFGHNGLRITDSAVGTDEVYNYGTFDFSAPNFELRFAQGTLPYRLAVDRFAAFMAEYRHYGRSVREQILNLTQAEAVRLRDLLEENLLPQNREYIYSSVYDNCATRVRDIVQKATGKALTWGQATPAGKALTFRQVFNAHLAGDPWQRFGINILTGTNVDQQMTNEQAMYLPAYLAAAVEGARLRGRPFVAESTELLPQRTPIPAEPSVSPALFGSLGFALLVCLALLLPAVRRWRAGAINLTLIITGLLGWFMLLMWLGTDHKICENNLNLLWALPTNLIAAFTPMRKRNRYSVVAIMLVLLVPLLHLFGIQNFPLGELWPVLLAQIIVFGMIFRLTRQSPAAHVSVSTPQ
jgi:hypothetical protein